MRWSEMTPRERDWALAEKQGWHILPGCNQLHPGTKCPDIGYPSYTTDDAAALELAKWMRGQGYTVVTWLWASWEPSEVAGKYQATIFDQSANEIDICHATLAAAISEAVWIGLGCER